MVFVTMKEKNHIHINDLKMAGKRQQKNARKSSRGGETGFDPKVKDLECFLNQPNINMVVPWIYDIYKNMAKPKSRDGEEANEQEDPIAKDLECFLNQPNINMTIPWIYEIAKAVKSGGGEGSDLIWDDRDFKEGD